MQRPTSGGVRLIPEMMNILFLSKNMGTYTGALYQRDVMEEMARQANVEFYGPGFPGYASSDTMDMVLDKCTLQPDWIVLGHAWLQDTPGVEVDPHPRLELKSHSLPKAVLLNKEYTNLDAKLEWIKDNGFQVGFSHHHDVATYTERTGTPFYFWPFAVNHRMFNVDGTSKDIDFAFSGLVRNPGKDVPQTDTRLKVMKHLHLCIGDIPVLKKSKYRDFNIFWNSKPRSRLQRRISRLMGRYRFLPDQEYVLLQKRAKLYLNTLSPAHLVGTRFFENMATKTVVFCEKSPHYNNIFPNDVIITFEPDLSDFDEKFLFYLMNDDERTSITEKAYKEVIKNHTWEKRISDLLLRLQSDIF